MNKHLKALVEHLKATSQLIKQAQYYSNHELPCDNQLLETLCFNIRDLVKLIREYLKEDAKIWQDTLR